MVPIVRPCGPAVEKADGLHSGARLRPGRRIPGHSLANAPDRGIAPVPAGPGPARDNRPPFHAGTPMQTLDFELDRDYVELKQLLKLTDLVSSGGEAKIRSSGRPLMRARKKW